eukprot:353298-Chlamydomonas_euryale.AAC.3
MGLLSCEHGLGCQQPCPAAAACGPFPNPPLQLPRVPTPRDSLRCSQKASARHTLPPLCHQRLLPPCPPPGPQARTPSTLNPQPNVRPLVLRLLPGPTAKLEHVSERFASLWTDLEQEKNNKRQAEASRFQLLTEAVQRLEKGLESEVKRRAESDRQLQAHLEVWAHGVGGGQECRTGQEGER